MTTSAILYAIGLLIFGACVGAISLRTWQRWKILHLSPKMNLHEARYQMLKHATRRPAVIMLGDSITAGVPWSEVADFNGIANFGMNGDTSGGVLYRLSEVIFLRPRAVFLMIGANDIQSKVPAAKTADTIRTIVDRLADAGIDVIVHPVLPIEGAEHMVKTLNEAVMRSLREAKVAIVPLEIGVADLRDGLHMGPSGFIKWHNTIRPLINEHCRSSP